MLNAIFTQSFGGRLDAGLLRHILSESKPPYYRHEVVTDVSVVLPSFDHIPSGFVCPLSWFRASGGG